jgi:site-specific DNA recombinase
MSVVLPVTDLDPAVLARRFGFLGRVSTEDNQDPEASYNWQKSRSRSLIEPAGGIIVAEYFDVGQSRSLPWKRRPRAAQLLADLADPGRGFDAVVIGEPQRAFYGNQYSLVMPVFAHYGVELWVPEVGGPIDPDSEAHDLIMSVFGGLSKGERNRIRLRVRAAMSAQAALEGRFLGGRPPYGYRLTDAGPHPNPAKAADGKRLHKLEPDPETAWVVRRIFAEYLAGRGLYAIAEGLTRDQIPSPSQHDQARNRHRTGQGWSKSAVRTILRNPRYTGRQVWNKQRKDEILLDVHDVAAGYETRMRWNDAGRWVWSEFTAHEPLVTADDFAAAQAIMAGAGRARRSRREAHQRVTRPYVLRGRLYCGYCGRRMQGQYSNQGPYYRCRYPREYALASHVTHPANVYLREADVLPAIDSWLAVIFAPHRLEQTIREMAAAQEPTTAAWTPPARDTQALIADCDARLARYQAALDAGADLQALAEWTRQVKAERTAALARDASQARSKTAPQLTEDDIRALVTGLDDLRDAIRDAEPAVKAAIYERLDLKITYLPGQDKIRVDVTVSPEKFEQQDEQYGVMGRVRGGTRSPLVVVHPRNGDLSPRHANTARAGRAAFRSREETAAPACPPSRGCELGKRRGP